MGGIVISKRLGGDGGLVEGKKNGQAEGICLYDARCTVWREREKGELVIKLCLSSLCIRLCAYQYVSFHSQLTF